MVSGEDYLYEYTGEMVYLTQLIQMRKEMYQYASMFIEKNQVPDKAFLETLIEHYDSGYGFAFAYDGNILLHRDRGAPDIDELMNNLEKFKEEMGILWLCKATDALLETDLQPFVILNGDDSPYIVACLSGNFSQYDVGGSSHCPEYHAVESKIRPRIAKLFKGEESDIDQMSLSMIDGDANEDIHNLTPEDASIVYLTSADSCLSSNKPMTRIKKLEWGEVYGAEEKKVEAAPASQGKKTISLAKKTTETPPIPPKASVIIKPNEDNKSSPANLPKDSVLASQKDSDVPIVVPSNAVLTCPPAEADNKDRVQAWYVEQIGYNPRNWKQRPWIIPKNQSTIKVADLRNSTADVRGKDTGVKNIPPPLMTSTNFRKYMTETGWTKILGVNSELIPPPDKIIDDELKLESAAAQLGKTSIKDFILPRLARIEFLRGIQGGDSNDWLILCERIWGDFQNSHLSMEKKINELENRITNLTKEKVPDKKTISLGKKAS